MKISLEQIQQHHQSTTDMCCPGKIVHLLDSIELEKAIDEKFTGISYKI
jgi:hypothetical protein